MHSVHVCVFLFFVVAANALSDRVVPTVSVSYGFETRSGSGLEFYRARLMCTHLEVERYLFWVRLMGGASMPSPGDQCEWELTDLDGVVTGANTMEAVAMKWASISPRGLQMKDDVSGHVVAITSPLVPLGRVLSFLVQMSAVASKTDLTAEDESVGMRLFSNTERPMDDGRARPSMNKM